MVGIAGMSSPQARREVKNTAYLPMTSPDDSSPHQSDADVLSSRHGRPNADFRMIPSEADCQVKHSSC